MTRRDWTPILERAAEIVREYGGGVTLRQLFYRLVSESLIENSRSDYAQLSHKTAQGRRDGEFPALVDHTREIVEPTTYEDAKELLGIVPRAFRLDRLTSQETAIYLGAEKATMLSLLDRWFGGYGFPILLLRGYGSETYLSEIADRIADDPRASLCVYAGDLDPSGEDIERDFYERTQIGEIVRVAVTLEQIKEYRLVKQPGKQTDTRARGFVQKHGSLFQIEVEALPPDALRDLYQREIDRHFDPEAYKKIERRENRERKRLARFVEGYE